MKLNFYVDENVLIPQPDTEILVEEVINIANTLRKEKIKILDMCTGSGCIAISLSKYISNAEVTGVDISYNALEVAKKNAQLNKVNNITWIKSNLFQEVNDKYDIIVSNPPYIKSSVIETLSEEVKNEPNIALNGGEDGLKFYNEIISLASNYLEEEGYLCFEIGFDQKDDVIKLFEKNNFKGIYGKKDFSGNDRIVVGRA